MKWRPKEGWEKPYDPTVRSLLLDDRLQQIYEQGADAMLSAVLVYLNEPCKEHSTQQKEFSRPRFKTVDVFPDHRYLCPQCMKELESEK